MMLSKIKNSTADVLTRFVRSVPVANRYAYTLSKVYIDAYRHYSYDPALNGENAVVKKAAQLFPAKFVFFDVGANVGDWTGFLLPHFAKAQGHLFELSRTTFANLQKRYAGQNNLVINNIALSDQDVVIEYKDYGENFGSNTIVMKASYSKRAHQLLQTQAMTGDSYCRKNNIERINFLKVDTEGADFSVLSGFKDCFARKQIDIVQFEYGYTHADMGVVMRDFFDFFHAHGYIVGRLEPKGVRFKEFEYTDNDFKSGPNYVACLPEFKDRLSRFS